MNLKNQSRIIMWIALALGAIAILGEYDIVVIKNVSKHAFELLMVGFGLLLLLRLLKK